MATDFRLPDIGRSTSDAPQSRFVANFDGKPTLSLTNWEMVARYEPRQVVAWIAYLYSHVEWDSLEKLLSIVLKVVNSPDEPWPTFVDTQLPCVLMDLVCTACKLPADISVSHNRPYDNR